jgi:ATP-dependent Clp protease ATP-binding subunit ClpA
LGSHEVRQLIEGSGIGFKLSEADRDDLDDRIYRASKAAVTKKFRPEFINRLDKIVVFRSLPESALRKILRLELENLTWRIWSSPFKDFKFGSGEPTPPRLSVIFKLTDKAFDFVLKEGTSDLYGARELNRTIDRYLGFPLATLIGSGQLVHGDKVKIDFVDGEKDLTFTKEGSILIQ